MYFQKMVKKLGHHSGNLVALTTKFPSIRPSFPILGNLVNIKSSPTDYVITKLRNNYAITQPFFELQTPDFAWMFVSQLTSYR